jgi:hypothetical protein
LGMTLLGDDVCLGLVAKDSTDGRRDRPGRRKWRRRSPAVNVARPRVGGLGPDLDGRGPRA